MTYNFSKKEKEFARWLVEQLRANDPNDRQQEFYAYVTHGLGGATTVEIRFGRRGETFDFPGRGGMHLIEVLVGEYLLLLTERGITFRSTKALFDLVDRDFMEHNSLDDSKRVLMWLVEEERAGRLQRGFHAAEYAPNGLEIADYNGDIIYELKKHGLAILDSLVSAGMLSREPAEGHGWKYTLLDEAYAAIDTDFGEAVQVERRVQIREGLVRVNAAVLAHKMNSHYDEGEVRELCRALEDIDYEDLPGRTKREKILSFIEYMDRRSVRGKLIDAILRERQDVDWSLPFKD